MDILRNPFQVGFGVAVTGTVTYTIEHTFDDVQAKGFDPDTATWYPHPSAEDLSANVDGTYAFPVVAVRLSVTAGDGTARLSLIQAGH